MQFLTSLGAGGGAGAAGAAGAGAGAGLASAASSGAAASAAPNLLAGGIGTGLNATAPTVASQAVNAALPAAGGESFIGGLLNSQPLSFAGDFGNLGDMTTADLITGMSNRTLGPRVGLNLLDQGTGGRLGDTFIRERALGGAEGPLTPAQTSMDLGDFLFSDAGASQFLGLVDDAIERRRRRRRRA